MSASFSSTYAQFLGELKLTFPEYGAALTAAESLPQTHFSSLWFPYTSAVAKRDGSIFTAAGIPLIGDFTMTAALWSELGVTTQTALWNYISSLLLLSAAEEEQDSLWDLSGFKTSLETLMKTLSEKASGAADPSAAAAAAAPEGFTSLFEKLASMCGGTAAAAAGGAAGAAAAAAAAAEGPSFASGGPIPGFKIPERLFKGQIAKIAEELVRDFKPEEFGIDPSMLESKDPARVFTYLQEIFTRKPELIMGAAQKIGKRLQAKFARGELNRDEIIREAEELMKEFSDNEAFSSLFGSLGELFKGSEKESGNEGSARRREVQERLRRKQAAKKEATAAGGATAGNTVSMGSAASAAAAAAAASAAAASAAADAATASLLEEEEHSIAVKSDKKRPSKK
jgi:hypothetical protein